MTFAKENGHPGRKGPIYLVLEKDLLVSSDLAGALMACPGAQVICAKHPGDIEQALRDVERLEAAFLELPVSQFLKMSLDKLMKRLGAHVIFTVGEDDEAMARQRGWGMLVRPFSDEMVYAALATFKTRR